MSSLQQQQLRLLPLLLSLLLGCLGPSPAAASSEFTFVGCFEDALMRRLETFQLAAAGSALTDTELQTCADACTAVHLPFVALQHGSLCYCSPGFPESARLPDSQCTASPCASSASLPVGGCGGVFVNAMYRVADETLGTCTDGVKDPPEYGVDCGGRCSTPCNWVLDSSFEHIYTLARGASKDITASQLTAASAWSGTGGVVATSGAPFGNGQLAPEGEYYFGWYPGTSVSQVLNTTREGYTYRLSWWASATGSDNATLVVSRDGEAVDELHIDDRFSKYSMDIECFETTMTLSFECVSNTKSQACLVDEVNFTATYECENVDDQTLAAYSGGFFSSCSDVITKTQADSYKCSDDVNDMFPSAINALAIPDE